MKPHFLFRLKKRSEINEKDLYVGGSFFNTGKEIHMDKEKLVLADGTEIMLESSQGVGALCVCAGTHSAACSMWSMLTRDNLREVVIRNPDGGMTGKYKDMILDHITGTDNADGTVRLTVCLREKTYFEILAERIAELEAGSRTHNEAIADLGQAVSDMAERGE